MFHFQKFISSVCHNIFSSTETTDYPKCQGSRGWESNYYEYDQFPTLRWWSWPVPTEDTETTRRIKDMDHPWSQPHLVWLWCSDLTTFGPHNGPSMPSPGSPHAWNYPSITFQHTASLLLVDNLPWSIFSGFLASLFAVMVLAAMEMLATSLISTSSHFLADPPLRTNVFRLPPPSQSECFYNNWLSNKLSLSQKVLGAVLKTSRKFIVVISRVERREAPPSGEGGGPLLMHERGEEAENTALLHNIKIQPSI